MDKQEQIPTEFHFRDTGEMARLIFTEKAWVKMTGLVTEFQGEVAWHGLAKKTAPERNEYTVFDVMIFPQTVTGASVTTDQEEYQNWLMALDDPTFEKIRFQGHSHVDFSPHPSSVDETHQNQILGQLESAKEGNRFYIFMILNKKWEYYISIYDADSGKVFNTWSIRLEILDGEVGFCGFLRNARNMVSDRHRRPEPYVEEVSPEEWDREYEKFWNSTEDFEYTESEGMPSWI